MAAFAICNSDDATGRLTWPFLPSGPNKRPRIALVFFVLNGIQQKEVYEQTYLVRSSRGSAGFSSNGSGQYPAPQRRERHPQLVGSNQFQFQRQFEFPNVFRNSDRLALDRGKFCGRCGKHSPSHATAVVHFRFESRGEPRPSLRRDRDLRPRFCAGANYSQSAAARNREHDGRTRTYDGRTRKHRRLHPSELGSRRRNDGESVGRGFDRNSRSQEKTGQQSERIVIVENQINPNQLIRTSEDRRDDRQPRRSSVSIPGSSAFAASAHETARKRWTFRGWALDLPNATARHTAHRQ